MSPEGAARPFRPTEKLGRIGRFIVILLVVVVLAGLGTDFCMGLPLSLRAKSPSEWATGILGSGALYVLSEVGIDWLGSKAQAPHPPWKRLFGAVMLLAFLGVVFFAISWLVSALT